MACVDREQRLASNSNICILKDLFILFKEGIKIYDVKLCIPTTALLESAAYEGERHDLCIYRGAVSFLQLGATLSMR